MPYPDFIAAIFAVADFSCIHFSCYIHYLYSGGVDPVHRVIALPNVWICRVSFLGTDEYPPFRFVGGDEAGNVVLTGYDPNTTYAVSLAALDGRGRIGYFSPEVLIGPEQPTAAQ